MVSQTPRELELHLSYLGPDDSYRVWARLSVDELVQEAEFTLALTDDEVVRSIEWMESGRVDEEAVRRFGSALFHALFGEQIHAIYSYARQHADTGLRLRLICADNRVARIPWELLYDPVRGAYLALDLPFVRDLATDRPRRPVATASPLRILIVESTPQDLPSFSGIWEARAIGALLSAPAVRQQIAVQFVEPATLAQVQNALREALTLAPAAPFDVVHFVGHGVQDHQSGEIGLAFVDDAGNADIVAASDFAGILSHQQLKLVFVNACGSAQTAGFDTAQGLAPTLLRAGIPIFVGMQSAVEARAAQHFAEAFYAALVDGRAVDAALLDARRLTRNVTGLNRAALAIPVCYMHTDESVLIRGQAPARLESKEPVPNRRTRSGVQWLQRIVGGVVALIGLIASAIGIWQGIEIWQARQIPPPMNGGYNIAIAPLATAAMTPETRAAAEKLAATIALAVEQKVTLLRQEGIDVQVRGPDRIDPIDGATAAERAQAAEALALQHNADLLVFGDLQIRPGMTVLRPEFFLAPLHLQNAEEISGYHAWDAISVYDEIITNLAAAALFSNSVAQQTGSWTEFVVGLGYAKIHRSSDALDHFQQAVRAASDSAFPVKNKTLYLLLGSMETKLADQEAGRTARDTLLAAARADFESALRIDPAYARALLGLGQLDYLAGRGDCRQPDNTDTAAMQRALATYGRARQHADASSLDELTVKAALFEARLLQCWAFERAEFRLLNSAAERYQSIVDEYDTRTRPADQQRIRSYTAEAFAGIGLDHFTRYIADKSDSSELLLSLDSFRQAEAITQELDRKAIIQLWQARVLAHQDACSLVAEEIVKSQQSEAAFRTSNAGKPDALYETLWPDIFREVQTLCTDLLFPTPQP